MTLALVFAMSGGAYAAKHYLITSTRQISPKVLNALQGKPGPAGPAGPAGTNGAGTTGTEGKPGANGKSVVAGVEAKGVNCREGGSNLEVEGSGVKHYACNGEKGATGPPGPAGQTGFTETLPSGKTLMGDYSIVQHSATGFEGGAGNFEESIVVSSVSFGIPLAAAPAVHYVKKGVTAATGTGDLTNGSKMVENVSTSTGKFTVGSTISGTGIPTGTTIDKVISATELELSAATTATGTGIALTAGPPAGCTGDAEHPGAASGNLCLFSTNEINNATAFPPMICPIAGCGGFASEGADRFGFGLESVAENKGAIVDIGTWAVTG